MGRLRKIATASSTLRPFKGRSSSRTLRGDARTFLPLAWTSTYRLRTCVVRSERGPWPRKVRVRANSPSLWPTMFSVMKIGTWRRPSCTAIVKPTISGRHVERRDHVRITAFWPDRVTFITLAISFASANGPFFVDLDMFLDLVPAADDVFVRILPPARPRAERRLPPRAARSRQADGRPALAAAVRVVARVHGGAAHLRPAPHQAPAARSPELDLAVLHVAHLADRRHAVREYAPHLAGRQPHEGVVFFARQ